MIQIVEFKKQNSELTFLPNAVEGVNKSKIYNKFLNCLMKKGKKSVAEKHLIKTLYTIKQFQIQEKLIINSKHTFIEDPLLVFVTAVQNVIPLLDIKNIRKSGKVIQIPIEVPLYKQYRLAIRWIMETINAQRSKSKKKPLHIVLALEIMKSFYGESKSIDKKIELNKKAFAQRAFSNYKF